MSRPTASLVVPSFGGAQRLEVLFEALRRQRCDASWEVVVVLDGVVDSSADVVAAVDDLAVRLVVLPENRGRPAALNAGFSEARGDVLIRCDDDLEPAPSYVADHVLAHAGSDPVGVVGLYRNWFGDTPYGRAYGQRYDSSVRAAAYSGALGELWHCWAGNCSVTRETFDLVGPYDESFRSYGWEDIDWGYRLAAAGVTIVLDPRLETTHHAANTDTVMRVRRAYASGAARAHFDAKHGTRYRPGGSGGSKARLWHTSVRAAATLSTSERFERWGVSVDRALVHVPSAIGYRLVALAADSAALAGYRDATTRAGMTGDAAGNGGDQ